MIIFLTKNIYPFSNLSKYICPIEIAQEQKWIKSTLAYLLAYIFNRVVRNFLIKFIVALYMTQHIRIYSYE